MPRIVEVGRPSLDFFGKSLAEIAVNFKNFGVGRIVIKESEALKYKEPCYYKLERVEPFMGDEKVFRCRAWAQRIYRGSNLGSVLIEKHYESDWKLVLKSEEKNLLSAKVDPVPLHKINCVTEYPPLVARSLIKQFPKKFSKEKPPLMLLKPYQRELDTFTVLSELTDDQKSRLWPPYDGSDPYCRTQFRTKYYIRRSDTPGIYWKVELEKEKKSE